MSVTLSMATPQSSRWRTAASGRLRAELKSARHLGQGRRPTAQLAEALSLQCGAKLGLANSSQSTASIVSTCRAQTRPAPAAEIAAVTSSRQRLGIELRCADEVGNAPGSGHLPVLAHRSWRGESGSWTRACQLPASSAGSGEWVMQQRISA